MALFTLEMLVKMYSLGLQVSNLYIVMYLSSFIFYVFNIVVIIELTTRSMRFQVLIIEVIILRKS